MLAVLLRTVYNGRRPRLVCCRNRRRCRDYRHQLGHYIHTLIATTQPAAQLDTKHQWIFLTSIASQIPCCPLAQLWVRGRSRNLHKGAGSSPSFLSHPFRSNPFPSPPLFPFPLELGLPLNQLRVLGKAVSSPSGVRAGRKRIWCTLELPESHW